MALQSESLKSPRKDFGSHGGKSIAVYARGDCLYFVGGGEFGKGKAEGITTSWYPFFKISKEAPEKEKGSAIITALEEYTVNIDYDEFNTGKIEEEELLRLSGLKNISSFYRNSKYCRCIKRKDSNDIELLPFKKERGAGNYSSIDEKKIMVPMDDLDALGDALSIAESGDSIPIKKKRLKKNGTPTAQAASSVKWTWPFH